jgi:hypothetical protein
MHGFLRGSLILLCAWLWAGSALAMMIEVQAGAHFRQEEDPGRETAVTCTLPGGGKIRLVNESYDELIYGDDIRWDYKTNPIRFSQEGKASLLIIKCYPPGRKQAAWITHFKLVSSTDF